VFAQNDHALRAFPLTCRSDGGLCRAAWSTRFDSLSSQPVYADGRVYALRGEDGIVAFDAHCSRRGGCGVQGDWHVPGVSSFTVAGTHVYAASGDEVAAFPATCPPQIGCHPLWRLGRLPAAPSTPVVADGLVFFTAGPQLYAVPTDCDHPGPNCASARVTDVPGNRSALSAATPTSDAVYAVGADGWLYAFTVPGH
jgi:outer membrane protein assembly factor BamB